MTAFPPRRLLRRRTPAKPSSSTPNNSAPRAANPGLNARAYAARFPVTYGHGKEVAQDRGFTVADEYLPRPPRRFTCSASTRGSTPGWSSWPAGTQPLHRAAVRQVRYLAALNPATAAASGPPWRR